MASSVEYHQEELRDESGNWLNKAMGRAQPVYACKENSADISALVGVSNVSTEDSRVYPRWYCNHCHSRLNRAKQAAKDGLPFHSITAVESSRMRRAAK